MATKPIQRRSAKKLSGLRKLRPKFTPPTEAVLRRLAPDDREILDKVATEVAECVLDPCFSRLRSLADLPVDEAASLVIHRIPDPTTPTEVLTAAQERTLFLRFNFCRYQLMRVLRRYANRRLDAQGTRAVVGWAKAALAERANLVRANTSLVLAMARRSRNTGVELGELVSEGNLALLRCVDKFDVSKGFKFSTYACRAILASFSRAATKAARVRTVFPASYDPAVERSDYLERKRERIELEFVDELRHILFNNSAELSQVEQRVLNARFALNEPQETAPRKRTLDQVGVLLGVSKERIRQIQNQAMEKLRAALEQHLPAAS